MAHDGVRPRLHEDTFLRRSRERREPGAERSTRLRDDERTGEDEEHARTLEPPAGVAPTRPDDAEHEDHEQERKLQRDPATATRAERRDLNQGE